MEEWATPEHLDKIKETAPLSPTELLPQKSTWWGQAKQSRNKQKESPKMGRQGKNPQLKGMEESPVKELNEIEASKLSDIEF